MTLYELSKEYLFLKHELVDMETGEVNETSLVKISEIKDTAENKCINIVRYLKELEGQQRAVEHERKKLQVREKQLVNTIERLKDYLLVSMEICEIKSISCPQFVITVKSNPVSVHIYDEDVIDEKYKRISFSIDKESIKRDLKDGKVVAGAKLSQDKSLRIR